MWFRSMGRVVWVGNADGRGGGRGGRGEDGVPEKRVRKDIGAVMVIVVVGAVVLVMVADRDPLTTLIRGRTGPSGWQRRNPESSQ